jgi:hypothetical protein
MSQKLDVTVDHNTILFSNPQNPQNDFVGLSFERTIRIPDDGKVYPLPPSIDSFPICKVDDYLDSVPEDWKKHGGRSKRYCS